MYVWVSKAAAANLLPLLLCRYDRPCIERWLEQGKTTCPATGQQLAKPMMLTPNISLRNAIEEWAERHQPQLLVRLLHSLPCHF
mgnify:FL=1